MRTAAGLILALVLAAGCQRKPPTEAPIKGRVHGANGQPLAGVVVRFHAPPDRSGAQRTISCLTTTGGTFEGRGLPGLYKVTLLALPRGGTERPDPGGSGAPPGVPAAYASPRDTPWEVEVPAGGKDDIVLEVGR